MQNGAVDFMRNTLNRRWLYLFEIHSPSLPQELKNQRAKPSARKLKPPIS